MRLWDLPGLILHLDIEICIFLLLILLQLRVDLENKINGSKTGNTSNGKQEQIFKFGKRASIIIGRKYRICNTSLARRQQSYYAVLKSNYTICPLVYHTRSKLLAVFLLLNIGRTAVVANFVVFDLT